MCVGILTLSFVFVDGKLILILYYTNVSFIDDDGWLKYRSPNKRVYVLNNEMISLVETYLFMFFWLLLDIPVILLR